MRRTGLLALIPFFIILRPVLAQEQLAIPMRDGVVLVADLYRPTGSGPWPAVLVRTPYGRRSPDMMLLATLLRTSGYAAVVQDTRGRFSSGGIDSVFLDDGWGRNQDGYDTVEWIAAQPWCNGRVGLWGLSALGIAAYLAAGASPPHLTCCFVGLASADLYHEVVYPGGVFQKNLVEGWLSAQGNSAMLALLRSHPCYDQFWAQANLFERCAAVNVPIFHLAGWYDAFCQGPINAFVALQTDGGPQARGHQALLVVPTTHDFRTGELRYPENSAVDLIAETRRWFHIWLKGEPYAIELPAVRFYLMGATESPSAPGNQWVSCATWPPQASWRTFFFSPGGDLRATAPQADTGSVRYIFDPRRPAPTIGGQNLPPFLEAGPYDQRANQAPDLVRFTTPPLDEPLEVVGSPWVTLYASSDGPDTDWIVKLVDVYPDGREMLVCDGALRALFRSGFAEAVLLQADSVYEFRVELLPTAIVFDRGHRVQLQVTSSSYPRFAPNPNTGILSGGDDTARVALNSIMCNAAYASCVHLPATSFTAPSGIASRGPGELPESPALRVYPNPARDAVTLTTALSPRTEARVTIHDLRGRTVRTLSGWADTAGTLQEVLELKDLPAGVYLVQVLAPRTRVSTKLVKVR